MTAEELQATRDAANVISTILAQLYNMADIGVNLLELEKTAEKLILESGAISINKGYQPKWANKPFPSVVCLSVNEVLAHGVPRNYALQNGDLLKIDLGVLYNGRAADAAITVPIGEIEPKCERLMRYAKRAVYMGINEIKPGAKVSSVGKAVEVYLQRMGYRVNHTLAGHGIGAQMHEKPSVPMFDVTPRLIEGKEVPVFEEGQVICVEPHVTWDRITGYEDPRDGWGVIPMDNKWGAAYEHMVLVTKDGFEVLTHHFRLD